MRLVIDAVNTSSPGGVSLIEQVPGCAERMCEPGSDVVILGAREIFEPSRTERVRLVLAPRAGGWAGFWRWLHHGLPRLALEHRADVVLTFGGMLSARVSRVAATVNYINNMLPFAPEHIRHFRPWERHRWRLMLLQHLYVRSSLLADAVAAPSRFGLSQVDRYGGGGIAEKSFVVPNPIADFARVDPARPPRHPYDGRPFLFYLSVIFWYKNHLNLIEAYRRAVERGVDLPDLLIAGPPVDTAYLSRMEQAIARGGLGARVRYLGVVPREDIPGYLHHATINMFPSTCETSSLVQSEILGAAGVMACSNIGPMPEVAGDAAELFDPHDPDSIATCMTRLVSDDARRAELRRRAAARASGLTIETFWTEAWRAAVFAREARERARSLTRYTSAAHDP